jgi:hypothetical protein
MAFEKIIIRRLRHAKDTGEEMSGGSTVTPVGVNSSIQYHA